MLTNIMKQSIFEAATAVLSERGVDGTTMNRVAEAAEVAKSSLYDYFPSKEELLDFVFDRIVDPHMQLIEETLRAEMSAPQKLERILRTAFEIGARHKAVLGLLVNSDQQFRIKQRTRPRILEAFAAIFQQGIEEGSFRPHDAVHTGRIFLGAFRELFELLAGSESEVAADEYVGVLIDMVLHGLFGRRSQLRDEGID